MERDHTDAFVGLLRTRAETVQQVNTMAQSASLALRQSVHDAWRAGVPTTTIAELTGLGVEQVSAIATSWPSPPQVVVGGSSALGMSSGGVSAA
jgi:hypothetical protein